MRTPRMCSYFDLCPSVSLPDSDSESAGQATLRGSRELSAV